MSASMDAGERTPPRSLGELDEAAFDLALRQAWSRPGHEQDGSRMIGRYRLLRELGRGGNAIVHLAEDTRLLRKVALKLLIGARHVPRALLVRFVREAQLSAQLASPGIVTILDSGFHEELPWIAMQYVEGMTLQQRLEERSGVAGAGPGRDAAMEHVLLIEKVARILHQAHEAGVVHRDLKPANLMVRNDGEPVILDFGLAARDGDEVHTLTRTGEHLGTPAYMSPEQIAEGRVIDRRTDIWALGVMLYEGVTGRRPFEAPTRDGLFGAILHDPLPSLRRSAPGLPRELQVVLETATEKDPARRYATAEDLAQDLRRLLQHEPVRARPIPARVRAWRWVQRHPALAAFTVAGAVVLAGALELLGRTRTALRDYEQLADLRRLEDLGRESQELWPAEPEQIPAMDAWLGRARSLARRSDDHREALAALRARGRVVSETAREDHAEERRGLEEEGETYRQWLAKLLPENVTPDWARWKGRVAGRLEEIASRLEALDREVRSVWRFDDERDQWRHDHEAEFVQAIEAFLADDPFGATLRSVEARRAFAAELRERTLVGPAAAWADTCAAVAADPRFHGLLLEPQLGLVPLGPDPDTGLPEFAHLASGVPPLRDRASGRLAMSEESAIVLVLVPGGTFLMGAQRGDPRGPLFDEDADASTAHVHEVALAPFFIAKHELTQGQWSRATGRNPSRHSELYVPKGGSPHSLLHPVESVTWHEARQVLFQLGLCLPTEAQWEYACRAGTQTPWWTGKDRESLEGAANLADAAARTWGARWDALKDWPELDDGYGPHAPVGSYRANPFGLHDVHGNVWEWCADPSVSYHDVPPRPGDGFRGEGMNVNLMATRGGAFHEPARYARAAQRNRLAPDVRSTGLGLRAARPLR